MYVSSYLKLMYFLLRYCVYVKGSLTFINVVGFWFEDDDTVVIDCCCCCCLWRRELYLVVMSLSSVFNVAI